MRSKPRRKYGQYSKKGTEKTVFFRVTETSWRTQNRFVTILYKYHKACLRVRGTRMGYKSYTIANRQIRKHTKRAFYIISPGVTYSENLQSLNQTTLKQRREKICNDFF